MPRRWIVLGALIVASLTAAAGVLNQRRLRAEPYGTNHCRPAPVDWGKQGNEFGELMLVVVLKMRSDHLFWNGSRINNETLRGYLAQMSSMNPAPNLVLVVDDRSTCGEVAMIREEISRHLSCGSSYHCYEYGAADWARTKIPEWLPNVS